MGKGYASKYTGKGKREKNGEKNGKWE